MSNETALAAPEHQQAQIKEIESPMDLGDNPYELSHHEELAVDKFGVVGVQAETRELASGLVVEGKPSLTLTLGGVNTSTKIELFDISTNPRADFKDDDRIVPHRGLVLGYQGDKPVEAHSNFVLVFSDENGTPQEVHPLLPETNNSIGRAPGKIGSNWLPATVSRHHLDVSLGEDGKLLIKNGAPTNKTTVEKPVTHPEPTEHKVSAEDAKAKLAEALPLSNEEQTADKLGIAGEVVASLDHASIGGSKDLSGILVVRRTDSSGNTVFTIAQKHHEGGILQVAADADKPLDFKSEDSRGLDAEGSIIIGAGGELSVTAEPSFAGEILSRLTYLTEGQGLYYIKKSYKEGIAREKSPRPPKPDYVVDVNTGRIEQFNPHNIRHFGSSMRMHKG